MNKIFLLLIVSAIALSETAPTSSHKTQEAEISKRPLADKLESNQPSVSEWKAKMALSNITENPDFNRLILRVFRQWRQEPASHSTTEILNSDWMREQLAAVSADKGVRTAIREKVWTELNERWNQLKDPTRAENVRVVSQPFQAGVSLIPCREPNVPRLGLIYPNSDVGSMHFTSAQAAGATTSYVNSIEEARRKVIEEYRRNGGKKMDVILASHGSSSYLSGLVSPWDSALHTFLHDTEGMINRAYLMGCNVGSGINDPNHVLRQFVAHGAEGAAATDLYLWSNGSIYYNNEWGGHLNWAVPNYSTHPWKPKASTGVKSN